MHITSSPWGKPQTQRKIAAGIFEVSCAGHGGILVTPERFATMPEAFRLTPGASGCWYEEDCEVHLVFLAFPDDFSEMAVWHAVNFLTTADYYPEAKAFLAADTGSALRERHKRFTETNGLLYTPGSMMSSAQGWTIRFRRISDGNVAIAKDLSDDEAFSPSPVDLARFGERVSYAAA